MCEERPKCVIYVNINVLRKILMLPIFASYYTKSWLTTRQNIPVLQSRFNPGLKENYSVGGMMERDSSHHPFLELVVHYKLFVQGVSPDLPPLISLFFRLRKITVK